MTWLTLDAGDAISGTAMSDIFQGYLDIQGMNRLHYDAMTLGVHDFDYGITVLRQRMSEAEFPILSANIFNIDSGQPFATPYVILDREGVRIAILGLTTGQLADRVAPENFAGLQVTDPVQSARQLVPQLTSQADIIIALTHLGINEDIRLASQVPEIDVIVGGMSHSELQVPMMVGKTLIVHDSKYGHSVGLLKLTFAKLGYGSYERIFFDSIIEPIAGKWVPNTNIESWLTEFEPQMLERMGRLIGVSIGTLSNRKVRSAETELGNYVCDILREKTGAEIALLPASFFRDSIPEGEITLGNLFTALPYDHYAVVLDVTGGEVKDILDNAADQIGNPGFPQVSGVSFGIFNGRAFQIEVNGNELDLFGTYRIVTSDYLADGALGYPALGTVAAKYHTGRMIRDLVREKLATGQVARSSLYARIQFLAQEPQIMASATPGATPPGSATTQPGTTPSEYTAPGTAPASGSPPTTPGGTVPAGGSPNSRDNSTPGDTTDVAPGESGSDINDQRYNRYNQPAEFEDTVITDPGSEVRPSGTAPGETPSQPGSTPVVPPTTTPPVTDYQPDIESAQMIRPVGEVETSQNGLDYRFSLVPAGTEYEYRLEIANRTGTPIELRYDTGERFDFFAYQENDFRWNYNHNRFFVQSNQTASIAPGEVVVYTGNWDGAALKPSESLEGQVIRFQAKHHLRDGPVVMDFTAELSR